jgi:hypothetical protein
LLLFVLAAGTPARTAPDAVRMLEAEGEAAKYWPRWRGPSGQGRVADGPFPDRWSARENIVWRVPVAGRGNSSPIVWGDRIFLTTAYDGGQRLSLICFRRSDGKQLWEIFVPQRGVEFGHPKNGYASATPVTDGRRVYASFGSHGLLAADIDGKVAWHRPIGRLSNYHGSAGSPVLYKDRIFLYQDHDGRESGGSFVAAFAHCVGRLGHAGGHQRQRTRRVDRQQPAARAGLRSGDRQGTVVRGRQHVRSDPDARRGTRPRLLRLGARRPHDRDPPWRKR